MPFLDHLEELRWRILWSLAALLVGAIIGFWFVEHYDVLALLKRPIAPLLPDGKLFVTGPTDAFIITLKLAVLVGAVLASPIVIWQTWAFLSPALYEREKKFLIPILIAGLFLFIGGALMAYLWVLPTALKLLFSFQRPELEFIITADKYFSFASLFILAFGVVFETPLVIVLLAAFGVMDPAFFAKNRPMALVVGAILAALLTPPDAVSMMLMLVPLMVLYEIGIVAARLVWRSRRRELSADATTALLVLLALGALAAPADGQQQLPPPRPPQDTLAQDSLPRGQPLDTAAARKLGLPTGPSRPFPQADSLIQEMLKRQGFHATRYAGDTLTLFADSKEIVLDGRAMVEREGSTLEADSVRFFQAECRLQAVGEPKLFDQATVLVGEGMRYNTCERRGIVADAFTSFKQSGVEWFLRGQLAVDSASTRLYAGGSKITSSDLPNPDYHFSSGEIKWVSNTIMVARPAILYVRDVPVLWLPFIFQDMRQGRRSGLLVPGFGLNDLVRPNRGFRRKVENIGYYIAFNDYLDAEASMDWYSGSSVQFNGRLRYHWLDRFVKGDLSVSRLYESGQGGTGSRSLHLVLNHNQQFNLRTRLNASINYVTSARVLERNSVDPNLPTASLRSSANFSKQYDWGSLQLGGTRSQELSSGVIQQTLPSLSLSPQPIDLAPSVTWNPSFNLTNTQTLHQKGSVLVVPPEEGSPREDTLFFDSRNTSIQFNTPLRIGSWNLPLNITVNDQRDGQRQRLAFPDTAAQADTLSRFYGETFKTEMDWNTGISLPVLFASTWRLAPRIGIRNATGGAFMLRNQYTGGQFVQQGKRLDFGAGISPTLFGFFPGFGPLQRIRHAISPSVSWSYAPRASVPDAYARALDPTGTRVASRSDPVHSLTFGLQQTFEAKLNPPPGDTLAAQNPRKIKLLSIQSGGLTYDIERAKREGLTGWTTQLMTNSLTSDLLPGFTLSLTHDLWDGAAGTDTARFAPFLTSVSTRFNLSAATFGRLLALVTGGPAPPAGGPEPAAPPPPPGPGLGSIGGGLGVGNRTQDIAGGLGGGGGLTLSVGYEDQRVRPASTAAGATPGSSGNRTLSLTTSFSPTRHWNLSWQTQYNFTTSEFGQHTLRLDRDLRRWRATFDFLKSPNGNFAFSFHITLLDQPDIKFNYDQRTVGR